jgi:hypothetical protein
MQFQSKAANEAYREIVSHVGRVVYELETEAFKEREPELRARMMLEAKRLSVDGLASAIRTAHHVEMDAMSVAAHFSSRNGG